VLCSVGWRESGTLSCRARGNLLIAGIECLNESYSTHLLSSLFGSNLLLVRLMNITKIAKKQEDSDKRKPNETQARPCFRIASLNEKILLEAIDKFTWNPSVRYAST